MLKTRIIMRYNRFVFVAVISVISYLRGNAYNDGDIFTSKTAEGITMTFKVISSNDKTCQVGKTDYDEMGMTTSHTAISTSTQGRVTIPSEVNGLKVVRIGMCAFYECSNVTDIIIPSTITTIGHHAFTDCDNIKKIDLPNSITWIGSAFWNCNLLESIRIPQNVTHFDRGALGYCHALSSVIVDENNSFYDSRDGCNAIIEKKTNKLLAGCKNTIIPANVSTIGSFAFYGLNSMPTIQIPNTIIQIESDAFSECSGLKYITIPNTVTTIGSSAFYQCDGLISVTSLIEKPYPIDEYAFRGWQSEGAFATATLYVPKGTKSQYQSTAGWKNFKTIQEIENSPISFTQDDVTYHLRKDSKTALIKTIAADRVDLVIPNSISYDGTSYTVTALGDSVFHNDRENNYLYSATFPSTIKEVTEKAFWWYGPSAIVWNSDTKLPEKSFDNWRYKSKNFILYVNNSSIAPSGVQNLVINGIADEIVLKDGLVFNCPKEFTAKKISYTHNYMMETGVSECAGWETIALPFEVQTFSHETKGELVPFAIWNNNSTKKPFWLYQLGSNGFVKASAIKANTPYIISMPNNSKYSSEYTVSGKVTFSSQNVTIKRTAFSYLNSSSYDGTTFYPCFSAYNQSATNYALNVTNDYFTYNGTEKPGSTFICDYRTIYPFEGRFYKSSASTRSLSIAFAEEHATSIEKLLFNNTNGGKYNIYDIKGILVRSVEGKCFEEAIRGLASGLYLVNGKKVIVR